MKSSRVKTYTPRKKVLILLVLCVLVLGVFIIYRKQVTHTTKQTSASKQGDSSHSQTNNSDAKEKSDVIENENPKGYVAGSEDKLLTNEFAANNPNNPESIISKDWEVTSGSLFTIDGAFYTGIADTCDKQDPLSKHCTGSNIFRANTKRKFTGDVKVSLAVRQMKEFHSRNCNDTNSCWHGTHIWLRHISQYNLYYASINRADGRMVIKRKVPCGSDNDGTYFELGSAVLHDYDVNAWNHYSTTIKTNTNGSVTISIFDTDFSPTVPIVTGSDSGGQNLNWSNDCVTPGKYSSARYSPITDNGSVGVRGDFATFMFKDFVVKELR